MRRFHCLCGRGLTDRGMGATAIATSMATSAVTFARCSMRLARTSGLELRSASVSAAATLCAFRISSASVSIVYISHPLLPFATFGYPALFLTTVFSVHAVFAAGTHGGLVNAFHAHQHHIFILAWLSGYLK